MLGGEVAEGDVREGADEVQVADDGEPAAGGRQPAQQLFSGSRGGRGRRRRREAAHGQEDKKRAEEQDKGQLMDAMQWINHHSRATLCPRREERMLH
uniref:Predicted protein n=1 Tax=Hordeum vulgare subsp. vulgare TaxID=112509 RepID=F2DAE7_HORVV|nr:predicted protein [Hordeum vulgare subsp. vulgare]